MICVDANVVVRLVVDGTPGTPVYEKWSEWLSVGEPFVAPALLFPEVTNALHRYAVAGYLGVAEVDAALDAVLGLGISLDASVTQHRRAMEFARRFALPAAYDAHYLAVAEQYGATLVTTDRRLLAALRGELTWVHTLES